MSLNQFSGGFMWSYYRQLNGNPCTTIVEARASTNYGDTLSAAAAISGTFATTHAGLLLGPGDYRGDVRRGLTGGYMFTIWGQPVSPGSLFSCQGSSWDNGVMGNRILP